MACNNHFPQVFLHSTLPQVYQQVNYDQLYNPQHCNVSTSQMPGLLPGNVNEIPVQFLPGPINTQQACFGAMSMSPQPNYSARPTTPRAPMFRLMQSSIMPPLSHFNENSNSCTFPNVISYRVSPVPVQPIVRRRRKTTKAELNTSNYSSVGACPTAVSISSLNHQENNNEKNEAVLNEVEDL